MMRLHDLRRRAPVEEHRGRADRHREGHGVAQPVGEEDLGHREDRVVLADAQHLRAVGVGGGLQAGMHVAHALGLAGGAGGIEPEGNSSVSTSIAAGHDDVFQERQLTENRLDHRQQGRRHEQHLRAAVGQHVPVLIGGQQRVERHGHDAGTDGTEEHARPVDGIVHQHGHPGFAVDAQGFEQVCNFPGAGGQFGEGQLPFVVDIGKLAAAAFCKVAIRQVKCRVIERRIAHRVLPYIFHPPLGGRCSALEMLV
jgi:hypothetical protein